MQGPSRFVVNAGATADLGTEGLSGDGQDQSVVVAGRVQNDIILGDGDNWQLADRVTYNLSEGERQQMAEVQDGDCAGHGNELAVAGDVYGYGGPLSDDEEAVARQMGGVKLAFGGRPEFVGPEMFVRSMLAVDRGSVDLETLDRDESSDTLSERLETDSAALPAYGQWQVTDHLRLDGLLGYGWHRVYQNRITDFTGTLETLTASYTATQWTVDLSARTSLTATEGFLLTGVAKARYGAFDRPGYTGGGSSLAAFAAEASRHENLRIKTWLQAERYANGRIFGMQGRLTWLHEHGDHLLGSNVLADARQSTSPEGWIELPRDAICDAFELPVETARHSAVKLDFDGTWPNADQSSWRAAIRVEHRW